MPDEQYQADPNEGSTGLGESAEEVEPQPKRSLLQRIFKRRPDVHGGPYTSADVYFDEVARDTAADINERPPPEI